MNATPNLDPKAIEAGKLALVRDTEAMRDFTITDRATYEAVGAVLIERLREYYAAKAFREKYTAPAHKTWKGLCELLSVKPYEDLIAAIKASLGAYDLRDRAEKLEAAQAARALVAEPAPNVQAITEALTIANAPEAQAAGVSTRIVWVVKRIEKALLLPEYLRPDEDAIGAEADRQGTSGDTPPVIPGVIFEQVARIAGRR